MSAGLHVGVYPGLSPGTGLAPRRPAAYPFDQPGLALTHLGRGAVWLALRALRLGPGSRVAMPAYHCGSEVEAARLAGVEIDFYRVDASLRVDEDDLARAAAGADAAYLISHFGFPMPALPAGALAIEDVAHGLFSDDAAGRPLGSRGQAAIFCPRKSLGVPDGGALVVAGRQAVALEARPNAGAMARSTLSLLAARAAMARPRPLRAAAAGLIARASRADAAARAGSLTETVIGEWDLRIDDLEAAAGRPSRVTERLVRRIDARWVCARRRSNYATLAAELGELCFEPFRSLPSGTTPLYLPVLARDRGRALGRLLDGGVRAVEIWPVPHPLLDRHRFAELEPLRRGLLALPVHQDLDSWHLEVVARAAKAALSA
ncbi:MAG: DegT/DnrJ/EryC1/StrS family aminotransferase [Solirubrobacteraceae bacterium]